MDPGAPAEAQPMPAPDPASVVEPVPFSASAADPAAPDTALPPPPAPPQFVEIPKRPGQLSPGWRLAFGIGWALIIIGYAAVWESSRVIGLSTWWLGADAEPRMILIQLLPFYGPILVTIAAISNWRYLPYLGIGVACVGAAIGIGDLGRVEWLAVVELVLAGAGLCISLAALAGMYRKPLPARPAPAPSV
jgi:hypothetical protein